MAAPPPEPVPHLGYLTRPTERGNCRGPSAREGWMSFETISLLLNWVELGVLLAILFRLGHTFELIASTQRELRRAIHHLGEQRAGINGERQPRRAAG